MRLLALATLSIALGLVGCGGPEIDPELEPAGRTATLTVIVWSAQVRRAVPATGTITSTADGRARDIDTRTNPEGGQSITGLAPGAYRVQITRRYDGGKTQAVEGIEEIYLEPGSTRELTIVTTDKPGEL